jgi:hypothetical protein
MEPKRYSFNIIFDYNYGSGSLVPKYDVVINNHRYRKGQPILKNISTLITGLNLFNYIGQDIAGKWDSERKELTIVGFF